MPRVENCSNNAESQQDVNFYILSSDKQRRRRWQSWQVPIFKHCKILIMESKKERNHYNLKEIENYCKTKTFPKRLAGKWEKENFRQAQSDFLISEYLSVRCI